MRFVWDDYFETGVAVVDSQHRTLVDMINEVAPLLESGTPIPGATLIGWTERLFDYARLHFATEEGVMQSGGLLATYRTEHAAIHRDFVAQVTALRVEAQTRGSVEASVTLLRFLTSWLTLHILREDMCMARQLRLIAAGSSPQQAREASMSHQPEDDKVRTALMTALLDLYTVLGERNRILGAANERLEELRSALQQANEGLEARVAERTVELNKALREMARTQGQLLQSEKMAAIGQLAAGVAHEINTPIAFVGTNLTVLDDYLEQLLGLIDAYGEVEPLLPAGDPRHSRIAQAREAADLVFLRRDARTLLDESRQGLERVRNIVQDLRDFSHVDAAEWQQADLNACLGSTLNLVWSEVSHKAEVVKDLPPLPRVWCNAAQINQVFMNLLLNAMQAIEGHGTLYLRSGNSDTEVWVEVADTGSGMTVEQMGRIFEPFFTTKPVGQGTGLGLSIAYDIVKKHDGRIEVTSAPGSGACFRVVLPRKEAPACN